MSNEQKKYDKYCLEDLKKEKFNTVCELYDNKSDEAGSGKFEPNTLIYAVDEAEKFHKKTNILNKKRELRKFQGLLYFLSIYHEAFFYYLIKHNEPNAKEFCDLCSIKISKIQNLYIIPLINEISLFWGKISLAIAVVLTFLATILSLYFNIATSEMKEESIKELNFKINQNIYSTKQLNQEINNQGEIIDQLQDSISTLEKSMDFGNSKDMILNSNK